MSTTPAPALVSTQWVADNLHSGVFALFDASHHLPNSGRSAREEYEQRHIVGAALFDIDDVSDHASDLPHMLPSAEVFASKVGMLGVGDDDHVVIYDTVGTTGAARVWWTFRAMGHDRVSVMDGGLPKWIAEGRAMTSQAPMLAPKEKTARAEHSLVRSREDIIANIGSGAEQVVDARSAGRFTAVEPEPRAGMRSGHIPGSQNVPYPQVLNENRTFKSPDEVRAAFEDAGVDLRRPIVTTCGSGVTASSLALALFNAGIENVAVYDGSWSEWGGRADTPIDT
jgi:thiosulfate/3-mercaptopyruvate sulfurtransferase